MSVSAGTFGTFLIRCTDQDGSYSELYYSPEVGNYVKELYYDEFDILVKSAELIDYTYKPYTTSPIDYWIWTMIGIGVVIVLLFSSSKGESKTVKFNSSNINRKMPRRESLTFIRGRDHLFDRTCWKRG